MVTELEKAYAAGLFDGEGCIMIDKPRRPYARDNARHARISSRSVAARTLAGEFPPDNKTSQGARGIYLLVLAAIHLGGGGLPQ